MPITRKTPVPARNTTIGDARAQTKEARRILDQMLVGIARMTSADRELVVLTLKHVGRELELAAAQIQQNKAPTELEGLPASLALVAALRILMPANYELRLRFEALAGELNKAA